MSILIIIYERQTDENQHAWKKAVFEIVLF